MKIVDIATTPLLLEFIFGERNVALVKVMEWLAMIFTSRQ